MEGSQKNPLFRVTGIPLHTHNATALLEVEMSMIHEPIDEARRLRSGGVLRRCARPGDRRLRGGVQRARRPAARYLQLEFGHGPAPARELRQLHIRADTRVSANDALKTMTFVDKTFAYGPQGRWYRYKFPVVFIPIPGEQHARRSKFASRLLSDTTNMMHLEFWKSGWTRPV